MYFLHITEWYDSHNLFWWKKVDMWVIWCEISVTWNKIKDIGIHQFTKGNVRTRFHQSKRLRKCFFRTHRINVWVHWFCSTTFCAFFGVCTESQSFRFDRKHRRSVRIFQKSGKGKSENIVVLCVRLLYCGKTQKCRQNEKKTTRRAWNSRRCSIK